MSIILARLPKYIVALTLTLYISVSEFGTVVKEIDEEFTVEERERLFQFLISKRAHDRKLAVKKKTSLQQVESLWALLPEDGVDVTDEELDEMKVQWRMEKYG